MKVSKTYFSDSISPVQKTALVIVSGILTSVAVEQVSFWLGWVCMAPFIIVLKNQSPKTLFRYGLLYGAVISFIFFFWMIHGASRYTGGSSVIGLIAFILSSLVFTFFISFTIWLFGKMTKQDRFNSSVLKCAMLFSLLWMLMEAARFYLLKGFPFFALPVGLSIADNLYAIQPVAIAGQGILTLIVVFVNYLFAEFINEKQWKRLLIPSAVITIYIIVGYGLLLVSEKRFQNEKSFKIALATHNLPPETVWNEGNENLLAKVYTDLNEKAVALSPDLIVWTESAIPWKYTTNDPLIHRLKNESDKKNIPQLFGVNKGVPGDSMSVYDSALLLSSDGSSFSYDKQYLLSLLEKPLIGNDFHFMLPFLNKKNSIKVMAGPESGLLPTVAGKAGVMICNESVLPAYDLANNKATYLINMGNDGWFDETYLITQHFYNCRLRAVETAKDVVVNINRGYVGVIESSGKIMMKIHETEPEVNLVNISANSYRTLATQFPNWLMYAGIITIIIFKFFN